MMPNLRSTIEIFIHPGEYEFADENFCVRTTLGSCVAIVLWHPRERVGGMCHYMLPGRDREKTQALNAKYGDEALELLLQEAEKLGTRAKHYEIKLFGGGNMFQSYRHNSPSVAVRNVDAARSLIAAHGLKVRAESLGGTGYRNVIFDIASGDVWVRHVGSRALEERWLSRQQRKAGGTGRG